MVFDGVGELPVETDSKFAVGIEKRCGEARHLIHYALPPPRVFVDSASMINVLELPDMNIWNRRRNPAHDVIVIEEAISGNPKIATERFVADPRGPERVQTRNVAVAISCQRGQSRAQAVTSEPECPSSGSERGEIATTLAKSARADPSL